MANRYRQVYFEDGDVLDPRDWTRNMAELAAEFNGRLDRDNLDELSVATGRIIPGSFTVVENDERTAVVTLGGTTTVWQDIDSLTIECQVDSVVEAEWGGSIRWEIGANEFQNAGFRVLIAGMESGRSPRYNGIRQWEAPFVLGEASVPAGSHLVVVQSRLYNSDQPTSYDLNIDFGELIAVARQR